MRCDEAPKLKVCEYQGCRKITPVSYSQGQMKWNEWDVDGEMVEWNFCRGKREKPREKPIPTPFVHHETPWSDRDATSGSQRWAANIACVSKQPIHTSIVHYKKFMSLKIFHRLTKILIFSTMSFIHESSFLSTTKRRGAFKISLYISNTKMYFWN